MLYRVKAKYIKEKLPEFHALLTSGKLEKLHPAGSEIVESMLKRAVETEPGVIEWTENCLCEAPMQLERELAFDKFLTNLDTREAEENEDFSGIKFSEILNKNK